jgi:hypothetical protein
MTTKKALEAVTAKREEVTRADGRLEAAQAEVAARTADYRATRTDDAYAAMEAAERKLTRAKLDCEGLKTELEAAERAHAQLVVADYQKRLNEAAGASDLAKAWEPLIDRAARLYEELGDIAAEVVTTAQKARRDADAFDSLAQEALQFAKVNRVAAPVVPAINRQPSGILTLRVFRETLISKAGLTPDTRSISLPRSQGQLEEGHLARLCEVHGVEATDDLEAWKTRMEERSRAEAAAVTAERRRETEAREAQYRAELTAAAQKGREYLLAEGFDPSDIPMSTTYN